MTKFDEVRNAVAVADPNNPDNYLKPNADGSLPIGGTGTFGQTKVTLLDPTTGAEVLMSDAAMTVNQQALSTAAAQVRPALANRIFASVKNNDAAINVFVGSSAGVTTANGYLLKPGEKLDFAGYTGAIFAIAASGTPSVSYVEW